jgi:hypothetical protein
VEAEIMTGIGIVAIDIVFALALLAAASCLIYLVVVTWRARGGAAAPSAAPGRTADVVRLPLRTAPSGLGPDAASGHVGIGT